LTESSEGPKKYDVTVRLTAYSLDEAITVVRSGLPKMKRSKAERESIDPCRPEVTGVEYLGKEFRRTTTAGA
jgi:hypothetical protein